MPPAGLALRRPARLQPGRAMPLVELCFPTRPMRRPGAVQCVLRRIGKTAVEVPDEAGLRRQPAAVPVPVRRRQAARATGPRAGSDRCLHEARRLTPDGAARAARPGRARRGRFDRRSASCRQATVAPSTRAGSSQSFERAASGESAARIPRVQLTKRPSTARAASSCACACRLGRRASAPARALGSGPEAPSCGPPCPRSRRPR